jgi:NADH:ubiquinone oxidoreductase subunit 2 (subunit N)
LAAFCFLLQIEEWFVRHGLEASEADRILSLRGLAKVKPGLALGLSLALSGLAGILPSMLVAKLLLVNASFGQGLTNLFQASNQGTALLALLGTVGGGVLVASSVLAVFYYFYPIKRMFVDEPEEKLLRAGHDTSVPRIGLGARANLISATTILILGFAVGLMPQLWLTVVQNL